MSALTFNTLKFSQQLEKAGATREYAIAEAEALSEVFETGLQDLASKTDIQRLDYEIKLLRWMIGLSLAMSTGIIALLAKLFIALPH